MTRLTSDMFVSALMRRIFNEGGHCVVAQKGAQQAGAIFIRAIHRDRSESLYTPAPQSFFADEAQTSERIFEQRYDHVTSLEIDELVQKEKRFDPDIWVVEIETDKPEHYINLSNDSGAID